MDRSDLSHCPVSYPVDASLHLSMGLDLTTGLHLVVHGTSGSTSYETTPHVPLESSGDMLSTVDMVVQRRNGPRRLREHDDDDDEIH